VDSHSRYQSPGSDPLPTVNRVSQIQVGSDELERYAAGVGVTPPEEVYEASLCALVEFPAVEIGGVGGNAPTSTCLQAGALLVCHDPK